MLLTILIILLIFALLGGFSVYATAGLLGFSPLGVIIVILLILALTGNL